MSVTAGRTTFARLFLCVATLVLMTIAAAPAGAADQPPQLLNGVYVTGATVKTPGKAVRKLDANQATAFMQAWLPESVFGHLPNSDPPKSLPVTHVDVGTTFNGKPIPIVVIYATDGTNAWVGMPGPQSLGWAVVTETKWIQAPKPATLMKAFAGQLTPVTSPPATTTTTNPVTKSASPATKSSSSSFPWVGFVIVLVVVAGIAVVLVRMRAGRSATAAAADSGARK
jgi:hypothetical protein